MMGKKRRRNKKKLVGFGKLASVRNTARKERPKLFAAMEKLRERAQVIIYPPYSKSEYLADLYSLLLSELNGAPTSQDWDWIDRAYAPRAKVKAGSNKWVAAIKAAGFDGKDASKLGKKIAGAAAKKMSEKQFETALGIETPPKPPGLGRKHAKGGAALVKVARK